MAKGRRSAIGLAVALISAMVTLSPIAPARAGCSFDDILNAVENTIGSVINDSCLTTCGDPVTCAAVIETDVVLAAVSAQANQSAVNDFCSAVSSLLNEVNSKADNASTVVSALQKVVGSSGGGRLSDLSSAVSSIANPLGVAECACGLKQGFGQLGADLLCVAG